MKKDTNTDLWKHLKNLRFENAHVFVRAIQPEDVVGFSEIAIDADIWRYFVSRIDNHDDVVKFVEQGIHDTYSGSRVVFSVIEKSTNRIAGSMCYGNMSQRDARLEIGWSWLGRDFQGTKINVATKLELLKHAFQVLNCERVEFKTDVLNTTARKALIKIGATEEGVLRSHTLMADGRRRDTIFYSILKSEWPSVQKQLEAKVN